ncbi:hypothetical protein NDN08_006642 [Rhodosorus marinus]|uniref:Uncharacterized protein n=1 Tax=Rhodosorus marinus TaxID=101924 RepID=A0AAV8UI56_9RHOD|nr:hypothetical protein NDN08_006642 [Rhodosorus marinus]
MTLLYTPKSPAATRQSSSLPTRPQVSTSRHAQSKDVLCGAMGVEPIGFTASEPLCICFGFEFATKDVSKAASCFTPGATSAGAMLPVKFVTRGPCPSFGTAETS